MKDFPEKDLKFRFIALSDKMVHFIALKSLLLGFLILSGLLVPLFFVKADTPFLDNFDSYNVGNLAGQGGWWTPTNSHKVNVNYFFSAPKSIRGEQGYTAYTQKMGNETATGSMIVWFYIDWTQPNYYYDAIIGFSQSGISTTTLGYVKVVPANNQSVVLGSVDTIYTDVSVNVWHSLWIQWNSTDDTMRITLDAYNSSDWLVVGSPVDFIDTIWLSSTVYGSNIVFWDSFLPSFAEYPVWSENLPQEEECTGYDLIERLICEIKNMVINIFLPSQSKINELNNTISLFKDRFPFSYLTEISVFFNDIKDSLEEEKTIPIKIFGVERNVNFNFWNKEGEVGGQSETIKNAVKDFISLIIIIGFLTWLLSFVRRFWS